MSKRQPPPPPAPILIQKTIFGFSYKSIKPMIKVAETMGGSMKKFVTLRHGMFICDFDIKKITQGYIIMESGFKRYKILK